MAIYKKYNISRNDILFMLVKIDNLTRATKDIKSRFKEYATKVITSMTSSKHLLQKNIYKKLIYQLDGKKDICLCIEKFNIRRSKKRIERQI